MKISQAIIVEGTYDKIKLSGVVDALIVTTDGFDIINNKEKLSYIKTLAKTCGIVILTDSDRAGFLIRNHIKGAVSEGQVLNAYIPDVKGKEHRKRKPSKEGFLGVEGLTDEIIKNALISAGCTEDKPKSAGITKTDLYEDGLLGGNDSRNKRIEISEKLGLPGRLSANAFLDALNRLLSYDKYKEITRGDSDENL
ncbi:MAG: DUF4093 domain-containing protein [Clostridia bacterium]|nr:DUF4093 domain-containing protein [Clostridia bacterium]